jgi:predicted nucleic acid-binding protein
VRLAGTGPSLAQVRKAAFGKADAQVVGWLDRVDPAAMFLSVIVVMELELGRLGIERRDPAQASRLRHWLEGRVLPAFDGRILPVDLAVARRCARLHAPNPLSDRNAFMAATALVHGMTVVTRNVADFSATGVLFVNPWIAV